MKSRIHFIGLSVLLITIYIVQGCTKDVYLPSANNFLKKIKSGGYVVEATGAFC